ncbi:MAG TPA: DUF5689 domain-containing protein [Bacteroidales bacterium]|nr:DUF5689 domain-containing protein [Bacteroidales bacterium]
MKTFKMIRKILVLAFAAVFALITGCSKEFDVPPVQIPVFTLPTDATLISIKQLKARHTVVGALDSINDNVYVGGKVIGNDESGNIYKGLYIQDTSGGLYIGLDKTSLYNLYKVGQRIYVKCKGLFLGDYGGMTQLGAPYAGSIGRIPEISVEEHLLRDSLPGNAPAPKVLTISDITPDHYGMLIQLDDVSILEAGQPFASTTATTNRTISDGLNTILLRTSNYASFAADLIPNGQGSIRGILSVYSGDLQLYIRDLNDLIGFDFNAQMIINESFATAGSLGTFTQFSVTDPGYIWTQYVTPGGTTCAKMTSYGSSLANEDWLISPSINLDQYTGEKLKFSTAMKYGTVGDGTFKAYVSSDYTSGDPNTATWTELTIANLPSGADWNFVSSGDIDLSAFSGSNVHIGFKYTSGASIPTWEITSIILTGTHN